MKRNRRSQITISDIIIALGFMAAGWVMAWILFSVPVAGAAELEIVKAGPETVTSAKICFEDVSETPGPPRLPVCFGPDQWDIVSAPDYAAVRPVLYLAERIGMESAVYALQVSAVVCSGK